MRKGHWMLVLAATAFGCGSGASETVIDQPTEPVEIGGGGGNGTGGGNGDGTGGGNGGGNNNNTPPAPVVTPEEALAAFETDVVPIMNAKCAICHAGATAAGPAFLGLDETEFYTSLINDPLYVNENPDDSLLLTYPIHAGPLSIFDVDEHDLVLAWLQLEAIVRFAPPPPPPGPTPPVDPGNPPPPPPAPNPVAAPTTLSEGLARLGACMSLVEWDATGMGDVHNQGTAQGTCAVCHAAGLSGTYLSEDSTDTFERSIARPYILKFVTGTVDVNGDFAGLLPNLRFIDKGVEACDQQPCHPAYEMDPIRAQAITDFIELSLDRYNNLLTDCSDKPAYVQAENLLLDGYTVDPLDPGAIALPEGTLTGTASYTFNGVAGSYEMYVTIIAEDDGTPTLEILKGDELLDTITYPEALLPREPVVVGPILVDLVAGDVLVLQGTADQDAWAGIDRFRLTEPPPPPPDVTP
ncbi:MAG: hypothetical protein AAF658_00125 [Myxococcota bacterium]